MEKNRPVILYGAGYRGGRNFLALAEENVHVEAFCDRDADNIPLYYGCEVYTLETAAQKFHALPFIVCLDHPDARAEVVKKIKDLQIEVYESFEAFFQGENDLNIKTERCGTKATFQIIPELLNPDSGQKTAYCFGIGFDDSFERELAQHYGVEVFAFDPSPEVTDSYKVKNLPDHMTFYPYGLSDYDGVKEFYLPSSGQDYSEFFTPWTASARIRMQVYRLKTLMKKLGHTHLDLLKIDIEGSEFLAMPDILNSDIEIDQLCIETHTRIFADSVSKMRDFHKLLKDAGFLMVSNGRQEQTYISKNKWEKMQEEIKR